MRTARTLALAAALTAATGSDTAAAQQPPPIPTPIEVIRTTPIPAELDTADVELHTATSLDRRELPATGINHPIRFAAGVGAIAAGVILFVGGRACRGRKDLNR